MDARRRASFNCTEQAAWASRLICFGGSVINHINKLERGRQNGAANGEHCTSAGASRSRPPCSGPKLKPAN